MFDKIFGDCEEAYFKTVWYSFFFHYLTRRFNDISIIFYPWCCYFWIKKRKSRIIIISVMQRKLSQSYQEQLGVQPRTHILKFPLLSCIVYARQDKKTSSQGIIVEVSCKVKLMRHFRRQLFKKFLLCTRVLLFIKGVTQQSDEVIGVTSNEVTRNRVTGKKFKE